LFVRELLRGLHRVIHVARRPSVLLLIEQAARFLEVVERLTAVAALLAICGGFAHCIGRILQSTRRIRERLILLLACETLELARLVFGLLREIALSLAALCARLAHSTQAVRLATRAIVLLLLARRELAQLLERFVDLVVRLLLLRLLLTALHR